MKSLFQNFFLLMAFIEFILGILGNGFLGLINCIHWVKSSKISLSDLIIMNLAFSRIILQCVISLDGVVLVFYPSIYDSEKFIQIREIGWTFSNYLSIWLVTCLSVFYCLKIAIFSHPAFLWLKWRVSQVVAWILFFSVLFSLFNIVSLIRKFSMYSDFLKMKHIENCTEISRRKEMEYYNAQIIGLLWSVIPFIISLISYFLLILSLKRHTRMLQHHITGPRDMSSEAHVKATKVMFSFLLLFVFYLIIMYIGSSNFFLTDTKLSIMIIELAAPLYPSVHSFILILQNKNLKQEFLRLLWLKKGCIKDGVTS
ncbi:bitter taste receptor Modo-T2R3A [Monodelphis domestica]|uniref:Taste receptor type 2 n=1 Tax=Monodelphis domestica TaxID=13616 RepID=Q2ABA7_MONDO|nr:bitter taste receptor Modo-T2R3A [Monodelphis domestica]BAE80360.1 bitter taste receptor [Monodelphis domestica]